MAPATPQKPTPSTQPPYRQIRALHDDETITVYQAYTDAIASAAVAAQRLDASPLFRKTRMTWIKPSWAWMLYRAGYSHKDRGQERILALRMTRGCFLSLLARAALTHGRAAAAETTATENEDKAGSGTAGTAAGAVAVKVQWDPERTVRLERLAYRSIQIGIPAALVDEWVSTGIVGIEDVTDRARGLKRALDADPGVTDEKLAEMGFIPEEGPFEISDELRELLEMNV